MIKPYSFSDDARQHSIYCLFPNQNYYFQVQHMNQVSYFSQKIIVEKFEVFPTLSIRAFVNL